MHIPLSFAQSVAPTATSARPLTFLPFTYTLHTLGFGFISTSKPTSLSFSLPPNCFTPFSSLRSAFSSAIVVYLASGFQGLTGPDSFTVQLAGLVLKTLEVEDHDDRDEHWDPDSEMDVDVERDILPSKVKREIVEPQLNDLEDLRRTREHSRASDTAVIETSVKALDICSQPVDEDIVKDEENTVNDLARE